MRRWLDKRRGVKLNAKGLEQERQLIDAMSQTREELERRWREQQQRLRNLLGRDFVIVEEEIKRRPAASRRLIQRAPCVRGCRNRSDPKGPAAQVRCVVAQRLPGGSTSLRAVPRIHMWSRVWMDHPVETEKTILSIT